MQKFSCHLPYLYAVRMSRGAWARAFSFRVALSQCTVFKKAQTAWHYCSFWRQSKRFTRYGTIYWFHMPSPPPVVKPCVQLPATHRPLISVFHRKQRILIFFSFVTLLFRRFSWFCFHFGHLLSARESSSRLIAEMNLLGFIENK